MIQNLKKKVKSIFRRYFAKSDLTLSKSICSEKLKLKWNSKVYYGVVAKKIDVRKKIVRMKNCIKEEIDQFPNERTEILKVDTGGIMSKDFYFSKINIPNYYPE